MANDAVTRCDMRHVRANFKNDSPSFMSEKMRKKLIRALDPIDLTNLRPADARSVNIDEDLSAFERRNFDLVDDERLALLDQNGGGRFQSKDLATAEVWRHGSKANSRRFCFASAADTAETRSQTPLTDKGFTQRRDGNFAKSWSAE